MPLFQRYCSGPASKYCRAVSRSGFSRNCRSPGRRPSPSRRAPRPAPDSRNRSRPGGRDAEGHQRLRASFGQVIAAATIRRNRSTGSMTWSAVKTPITASGSRRPSTAALKPTALSVSRPHGSPINCSALSRGTPANRRRRCACRRRCSAVRRQQPFEPLDGKRQQGPAADKRDQLFGQRRRLIGHSLVPEPPAMIMA